MPIESKIDELIAALDRNTAAQDGTAPVEQSDGEPAKRGRKPKSTTESTQATPSAPATSAPAATAAPAPTSPASSPAPQQPPATLLKSATDAIIKLAGEYSRDTAVKILSGHGVTRCSELPPDQWQKVLDETNAAIAAAEQVKAGASLV